MTRKEQIHFVRQLMNGVKANIVKQIEEGRLPAHWTGIELRWLLADKFEAQAYIKNTALRRRFNNEAVRQNLL